MPCRPAAWILWTAAALIAVAAPLAATEATGLAVVEAFTDGSPAGQVAAAAAARIAAAQAPGSVVLVFRIPSGDPARDTYAARRGTITPRGHDADRGAPPALLVNGVVATDQALDAAVAAALAAPPKVAPLVKCGWWGGVMWVGISVPAAPPGALVTLALVEDGVESDGTTHDAVVRSYKTVILPSSFQKLMDVDLSIPDGTVRAKSSVIAVVQDASGTVIGAARCDDHGG
ncbi:MAG: hypothetical protein H0W83_13370 [Planctomycetes bacterium]|nr:hypothetical protein [Planctomycetota bacterium]